MAFLNDVEKYGTVHPDRPQMAIRRMRSTCRIPETKNTLSEYAKLIAFQLQQGLQERVSSLCLQYITNLVY